jgi:hypothetical protein
MSLPPAGSRPPSAASPPVQVHAGAAHAAHSRLDAPWIGAGTAPAGRTHVGLLTLRDAMGNECDADARPAVVEAHLREEFERPEAAAEARAARLASGVLVARGAEAALARRADLRRQLPMGARHVGGGRYEVTWHAERVGVHTLLCYADGVLLQCSPTIEVVADGASAAASELLMPNPKGELLPLAWNAVGLRVRDASGNGADLDDPSRLVVTCEGVASVGHVAVREQLGTDGAYEIAIFGEPVGPVTLHATLDGRPVTASPLSLHIVAASATPGHCYAFGSGLGGSGALRLGRTQRFTIVACDSSGTRRSSGGDAFKVAIRPRTKGSKLILRSKVVDHGTGGDCRAIRTQSPACMLPHARPMISRSNPVPRPRG